MRFFKLDTDKLRDLRSDGLSDSGSGASRSLRYRDRPKMDPRRVDVLGELLSLAQTRREERNKKEQRKKGENGNDIRLASYRLAWLSSVFSAKPKRFFGAAASR